RLLTLFELTGTAATQAYYTPDPASGTLQEAFAEIANLCCGELSYELSSHFCHLAMSIPNILDYRSLQHLGELRTQYVKRYKVTINDSVNLQVTLCLYCNAPFDFVPGDATTAQATGELEMF